MTKGNFKIYTGLILGLGLCALAALGAYTAWQDPYWIWRENPSWLESHHGHNRVLDIRLRHAKAMQILTRQPSHVILGSSRVYRGFDMEHCSGHNAYNLGLPRLRIAEAEAYVRHLIHFAPLEKLVLGLDYLMFDADETSIAYKDTRLALNSKTRNDGFWRRNGFRYSNTRDKGSLEGVFNRFQSHRITEKQYQNLDDLLQRLKDAEIETVIYLSPMSKPHLEFFKDNDDWDNFNNWRQRVLDIAARQGIVCRDFSTSSPFSTEDVLEHSTDHWVDASHFKPVVGNWILKQLGESAEQISD